MKPFFLYEPSRCAAAAADRAFDRRERAAARHWPAPAPASDATARWCRAARRPACRPPPSPARHRRGRGDRVSAARSSARVGQLGQAGAAQQRAQRRIAERGAVELAEMGVAAMAVEQQRDRRRRTATARPSGRSARARRRRRNLEIMNSCPERPSRVPTGSGPKDSARAKAAPAKPASLNNAIRNRRIHKCDRWSATGAAASTAHDN